MKKTRRTPVQKTASLHEKTVQAVAKGDVEPMPKSSRRSVTRPPSSSVKTIKALDVVMQEALKLAGGDKRRLLVVSENEVVVMNQPGQYNRSTAPR